MDEVSLGAGPEKFLCVETGGIVVAELADITRAQTPCLAGDDGGGDLAAGHDGLGFVLNLGAALREGRYVDKGVGRVQTHTDEVGLRLFYHSFILSADSR